MDLYASSQYSTGVVAFEKGCVVRLILSCNNSDFYLSMDLFFHPACVTPTNGALLASSVSFPRGDGRPAGYGLMGETGF